jgi:hypothetical protein
MSGQTYSFPAPSFDSHPSRFGHDAIARCEWCSSFEDFALFSLPAALFAYLGEAGVIGVRPSISKLISSGIDLENDRF